MVLDINADIGKKIDGLQQSHTKLYQRNKETVKNKAFSMILGINVKCTKTSY